MDLRCTTTTVEGTWQHPALLKLSGPPKPPKTECMVKLCTGLVYVTFEVGLRCGNKPPSAFWFSPPPLRVPVMARVFFVARSRRSDARVYAAKPADRSDDSPRANK